MKLHLSNAALLLGAFTLLACSPEPEPPPAPGGPAAELATPAQPAEPPSAAAPAPAAAPTAPAPQGPVVYLDVRTPEEFAAGHVEGAILLPYDQINARIAELERYRDTDMVVYCRTGRRSGIAIDALRAHGFSRLTNGGGLDDVVRARNVPVTTGT